jgi:spore coat polysaccharide biosynthesis protein SpsF
MPIGLSPYFINVKALEVAIGMKDQSDTEIWGPFVNRPDFFKIGYLHLDSDLFENDIRITCDYQEDYDLFVDIFDKFQDGYNPSIFEVSDLIKKGTVKITNVDMHQAYVTRLTIDKIQQTFNLNLEKGKSIAKKIGYTIEAGQIDLTIKIKSICKT